MGGAIFQEKLRVSEDEVPALKRRSTNFSVAKITRQVDHRWHRLGDSRAATERTPHRGVDDVCIWDRDGGDEFVAVVNSTSGQYWFHVFFSCVWTIVQFFAI